MFDQGGNPVKLSKLTAPGITFNLQGLRNIKITKTYDKTDQRMHLFVSFRIKIMQIFYFSS